MYLVMSELLFHPWGGGGLELSLKQTKTKALASLALSRWGPLSGDEQKLCEEDKGV